MPRPPDRRTPAILFSRDTSEWINRVNQKHKELARLQLSAAQRERLDRLIETEFVYSTLKLEGEEISKEQAARLASNNLAGDSTAASDPPALALLESLRTATSLASDKGKAAELSTALLLQLHDVPGAASGFRKGSIDSQKKKVAPAEILPAMIDSACQWYAAESFTELNPVEQASIVFLRLLELQPFEEANVQTALVAASLFTLRSGLPPIIIRPDRHPAYRNALEEGYRMNTKPMVELIAEAIEDSLSKLIEEVGRKDFTRE